MTALTIKIDGNEVSLAGTKKGDGAFEALRGTAWKWSRPTGSFVLPRNLLPGTRERNVRAAKAALEGAGFEVEIEDSGVRLSIAEEREQAERRLENRAERLENRAVRQAAEAEGRLAAADRLADAIPFGQPILVGHHSERRHRRDLERIHANTSRGYEAQREAEDAAERAANIARKLTDGTPTPTLRRRVERLETELRDVQRRIDGDGGNSRYVTRKPATGDYLARLLDAKVRLCEAIALDKEELARRVTDDGEIIWGPDYFEKGDEVAYWGGWAEVLKVNKKSLTVPSGYSWTDTVSYDKVRARRRRGVVTTSKG